MRLFFLLLIIPTILFCENKDYVVLNAKPGAGLFSCWMDVLMLCEEYEKGNYSGIEVDFEDKGAYYSELKGLNWWEYFCEPIRFGRRIDPRYCIGNPPGSPGCIENRVTRHQAKQLIDKYIHINPEIVKSINEFAKENFEGYYIISVHYRGSDKITEAPFVPYSDVFDEILKAILNAKRPVRIFLATDDLKFWYFMFANFNEILCYLPTIRTYGDVGLHHSNIDKYRHGLDAVKDMLLLSKGDFLIRTSSNLSRWSTWFNPYIPVVEMNQLGL